MLSKGCTNIPDHFSKISDVVCTCRFHRKTRRFLIVDKHNIASSAFNTRANMVIVANVILIKSLFTVNICVDIIFFSRLEKSLLIFILS